MKDSVILGTGTSKLLKSGNVPNSFAEFRQALLNGTLPVDITTDSAGYSQVGTALNKANLLSDQAAIDVWNNTNVPSNPVLSDAFQKLADRGSTLETDVSAIQTLLGDTAMSADMGTVSDSVLLHNKEIAGQITNLPTSNLDQFPNYNIYGTYWINLYETAIGGVKPDTEGQGILICKRQSSAIYRQIFIGVSTTPVRLFRYYTYSTGVWTDWSSWVEDYSAITFTPRSGITSSLFARRYGRVVTINGFCRGVTFSGANVTTELGTIADYLPVETVRSLCGIADQAYNVGVLGYIGIDPSTGVLYAKASSALSNRAVYFSLAYVWQNRT